MPDFNLQSLAILFQDETVYRLKSDYEDMEKSDTVEEPPTEVVKIVTELLPLEPQNSAVEVVNVKANNLLVPPKKEPEVAPQVQKQKINLIMVSAKLSPEMESFLQKIMNSIGYKLEQYVVVNSFSDLFKYEFEYLILFGVRHKSLNFEPYQITPFNSYKCLLADSLEAIEQDKIMKTVLWKNLQEMFGV